MMGEIKETTSARQEARLQRAFCALEGLSVGDAFGETFFINPNIVDQLIAERALRDAPWFWTDDTLMALSVVEELSRNGEIVPDQLATNFAYRYDISRGYGPAMHGLLENIRLGVSWRTATGWLFEGQGSWGNGAAMRVAPLGAYFADDLDRLVENAKRSATVTHHHSEGVAGAIAVAVAAGIAWNLRGTKPPARPEFIEAVLPFVPDSLVRAKLRQARDLATDCSVRLAVAALGNGTGVSAQDTVPFALWCAGGRLARYEEALWLTVAGLGDRDTTCAIVGGIVACYTGREAIPETWRAAREAYPDWFVHEK
jgi:ADP-ribosylglycohydrolase